VPQVKRDSPSPPRGRFHLVSHFARGQSVYSFVAGPKQMPPRAANYPLPCRPLAFSTDLTLQAAVASLLQRLRGTLRVNRASPETSFAALAPAPESRQQPNQRSRHARLLQLGAANLGRIRTPKGSFAGHTQDNQGAGQKVNPLPKR